MYLKSWEEISPKAIQANLVTRSPVFVTPSLSSELQRLAGILQPALLLSNPQTVPDWAPPPPGTDSVAQLHTLLQGARFPFELSYLASPSVTSPGSWFLARFQRQAQSIVLSPTILIFNTSGSYPPNPCKCNPFKHKNMISSALSWMYGHHYPLSLASLNLA